MTFGQRVRQLRQAKGMTLRALAPRVGVGFTYLSKVENGELDYGDYPSEALIRKLAAALDARRRAGRGPARCAPRWRPRGARRPPARAAELLAYRAAEVRDLPVPVLSLRGAALGTARGAHPGAARRRRRKLTRPRSGRETSNRLRPGAAEPRLGDHRFCDVLSRNEKYGAEMRRLILRYAAPLGRRPSSISCCPSKYRHQLTFGGDAFGSAG